MRRWCWGVSVIVVAACGSTTRYVAPTSISSTTSVSVTATATRTTSRRTARTTARTSARTTVRGASTTTGRAVAPTVPPPARPGALIALVIAPQSHASTYNRIVEFGGWIDQDGCRDTRAEVLVHQSLVPVTWSASGCTVVSGRWVDPWSGATTTSAHAFDIDHTVPLDNAWQSGAWSWSEAMRIAYANDLTDPDHLVAIPSAENRAKGDDGPDLWRPPAQSSWCRYALSWDHIKAKWHLSASPSEWSALVAMAAAC